MPQSSEIESIVRPMVASLNRRQILSLGLRLGLATPVIAGLMSCRPGGKRRRAGCHPLHGGSPEQRHLHRTGHGSDRHARSPLRLRQPGLDVVPGRLRDAAPPQGREHRRVRADAGRVVGGQRGSVDLHLPPRSQRALPRRHALRRAGGQGLVHPLPARWAAARSTSSAASSRTRTRWRSSTRATIRFNLGRPQPLFLAAMASEYGPFVVNPKARRGANKTDDDPFAHEWFRHNTAGSGPYRSRKTCRTSRVVLERFDDYHGGWDGNHFDQIAHSRRPGERDPPPADRERRGRRRSTFSLTPEDVAALRATPTCRC